VRGRGEEREGGENGCGNVEAAEEAVRFRRRGTEIEVVVAAGAGSTPKVTLA